MNLKFDEKGLLVAIAQDAVTGEVLMQAFQNEEAVRKTMETGLVHYFSRSRNSLWLKGETSGHFQHLVEAKPDCDGDAILYRVLQDGAACHTGNRSCFFKKMTEGEALNNRIAFDVIDTIRNRKENPKEGSYTNYLLAKGKDKILKKFMEECAETVIAAKNNDKEELIYELSDVVYHMLVLMETEGVEIADLMAELQKREGKAPEPKWKERMTK